MEPAHNSSLAAKEPTGTTDRLGTVTVSPLDINAPSSVEVERVNIHIQAVISHFLEALQIPESAVTRPTVFVNPDADTSCCKSAVNEIHIIPEHVGRLDVYGEEVGHWLRFQMRPPKREGMWALTYDSQVAVEEFFGYLGFCLARQLCSGDELSELTNSYAVESAPDVLRTMRSKMATIEKNLELFRDFAESEKAVELRNIARSLTFLNDQLQIPTNDTMNTLRFWDSIHTAGLYTFTAEPMMSKTDEGMAFELDEPFRATLKKFADHLTQTIARPTDTSATDTDGHAINLDLMREKYSRLTHLLAESISDFFVALGSTELRLLQAHKSLIDHCDGYEAAAVFLRNSQNPVEDLKALLTLPCRKVFFTHVFGAHLDAKHRPSSLSEWKEALRMGLRHLRS